MPDLHPTVQGYCPACRGESLFLGSGGYITCRRLDCPDPEAASKALERKDQPASHIYLSTGCLHGQHDYCAAMTGWQGEKRPASCKFCRSSCQCPCHDKQEKEGASE